MPIKKNGRSSVLIGARPTAIGVLVEVAGTMGLILVGAGLCLLVAWVL